MKLITKNVVRNSIGVITTTFTVLDNFSMKTEYISRRLLPLIPSYTYFNVRGYLECNLTKTRDYF